MAKEIEKKYLVKKSQLPTFQTGENIVQGYIPTIGKTAVRIRIKGDKAYLTIKGENKGAVRSEYEYDIPLSDAEEMIRDLCGNKLVEKTRFEYMFKGKIWEIDFF